MLKYLIKRILHVVLTLSVITIATFFLMHNIQGDPLSAMGKTLPKQMIKNYKARYGLDRPVSTQYTILLKNVLHEDLGASYKYPGREVKATIAQTAPVSRRIGGQAMVIGITIGVIFGILAALNRSKVPDYIISVLAILGITIPVFILGAPLQYAFAVELNWFPTSGYGSEIKYTISSSITSCFGSVATYARYMRSNVLEALNKDYVFTAKAKGVSGFNVIRKHVFRDAILPIIIIIALQIVGIFTGLFIIKSMYSIPGLRNYFVNSITTRDYPMIVGTTIFYAFLFLVSQLVVGVLYGITDPRIKIID